MQLRSFPRPAAAVVIGATGGIGGAFTEILAASGDFDAVIPLSRRSTPPVDLLEEASIANAAAAVGASGLPLRLVVDATGFLHGDGFEPEKALARLDPAHLARAFAINATGPALLMKHFVPLFPREGRAVFATLSAKVGSITDNRLGGWYSYRAAKAALNQLVRTAAIELARRKPEALCIALHPGTVDTGLSAPFARTGLDVQTPTRSAEALLKVIDTLPAEASGGIFDYRGEALPF